MEGVLNDFSAASAVISLEGLLRLAFPTALTTERWNAGHVTAAPGNALHSSPLRGSGGFQQE